jgi:hypothetical protein
MLLIYSPSSSPRLLYILDFIFKDILCIQYRLTQNAAEFRQSSLPKISYCEAALADELFFFSTKLLFEKGIREQDISVFDWEDSKAFFATHPKYEFPFDPFAASFYLVSRYEEYLPHARDQHDRFDVKESLAWKKGFLQKPLVNVWAQRIKAILQKKFPSLAFPEMNYQFISTIDVDNAYAFKEKGIVRTAGALARSLVQLKLRAFANRILVLAGRRHDPYNTYSVLFSIQQEYGLKCIYFFLLGDYAENDKNVPVTSKKLQSLIKHIADYNECGIHPSYASNSFPEKISLEKSRLRKIIRRDVTKSRQHFLLLKFPSTYRNLLEHDITDDYSMGHAGDVGFRASTCSSFLFYDLDREFTTKLRVHPFALMDATFKYYLKVKPEEALNMIWSLVEEVRAVDGTLISLWHNESLSEIDPWTGWKDLYGQMVKAAAT